MIKRTPHYRNLKSALRKARLITGGIGPLGCQTELQHLKLQSYIMLCHAAFEEYLENLGLDAARVAREKFARRGVITRTLVALISSKLVDDLKPINRSKVGLDSLTNIEVFSKEAFNRYRSVVLANHGIVDRDQKKLLVPIGVDPSLIDIALMNNLHAFGAKRGEVAHSFKVTRSETLSAINTDLESIVRDIHLYDEAVCSCLKVSLN